METEYEKMERLYKVKLAKYEEEQLDAELRNMLYMEAVKEVLASSKYNGGRKIRY